MNHIRPIAGMLAGLAATLLAFGAAPAAFAQLPPDPAGPPAPVYSHTVVIGGMPGWQISLIAVGAALLAAVLAVIADRMRATRQRAIVSAA